mgnify:CR=1 FL=1
MKDYTDVIIAPVITEKSMYAKNNGVYTFKVSKSANKIQIKNGIENYLGVKVARINSIDTKA